MHPQTRTKLTKRMGRPAWLKATGEEVIFVGTQQNRGIVQHADGSRSNVRLADVRHVRPYKHSQPRRRRDAADGA